MSKYGEFLQGVLDHEPKVLPRASREATSVVLSVDDETAELESKVEAHLADTSEGYGAPQGKLRDLFAMLVESGLLELFLSLLKK